MINNNPQTTPSNTKIIIPDDKYQENINNENNPDTPLPMLDTNSPKKPSENTINKIDPNVFFAKEIDLIPISSHRFPKNTLLLSVLLTFSGITLMLLSGIQLNKRNKRETAILAIFGIICFFPGIFMLLKLLRLVLTKSTEKKEKIMNEIPVWN